MTTITTQLAAALQNLAETVAEICPTLDADVQSEARDALAAYDALTVRIAHKGPSDFPNHQCPAESSAVWNACCMEHERVLAGEVPMLTTTALTSQRVDVARLTELLDKATPGPWRWSENGNIMAPGSRDVDEICAVYTDDEESGAPNAPLIVEAINALPALLQQLADAERARDIYKAADESMQEAHVRLLQAIDGATLARPDALTSQPSGGGITADWVVGYLPMYSDADTRKAVRYAFAEYEALLAASPQQEPG